MQRISEITSQMNNVPCAMTVFARPPGPMCLGLYQLKKFSLGAYTHMLTLNKANLSSWLCRRWQSPRLCSQTPQTLPSLGSQCHWSPSSASDQVICLSVSAWWRTLVWGSATSLFIASPSSGYTELILRPALGQLDSKTLVTFTKCDNSYLQYVNEQALLYILVLEKQVNMWPTFFGSIVTVA